MSSTSRQAFAIQNAHRVADSTSDVNFQYAEPIRFEATAKPTPLYHVPGRTSELDRTPRTYASTQSTRDSFLSRPAPVHETSSDARSWSRQTEDALDAYKRRNGKHRTNIDQFIHIGDYHSTGRVESDQKAHGIDEKTAIEVTEYRLASGNNSDEFGGFRAVQPNQLSEKYPSKCHAISIDIAQLDTETEQQPGTHKGQPQSHRLTKMVVKEDIDFFTALLEGHDPPVATGETQTFVRDETETRRQTQEMREREAEIRRQEEAQAAKADTDFFMMLMQKE